jgi:hypothetical protein
MKERRLSKMKSIFLAVTAATLGLALMFAPATSFAKGKMAGHPATTKTELRLALRDLWVEHIFWVRNVVLTTKLGDTEAAKVAEGQVVQNAKDIANSVSPYYGKEASDKLFKLLAGHYGAIKDYMTAAYAGNKTGKEAAVGKLKKNADEIASFLSSANPNWKKETLVSALLTHGEQHIAQIDAVSSKNYASEAKTWDAMRKHVYVIADVLANGIVKQFPNKFAK